MTDELFLNFSGESGFAFLAGSRSWNLDFRVALEWEIVLRIWSASCCKRDIDQAGVGVGVGGRSRRFE